MTAPAARATDCAMPPGLPMLPLVADVALGRRALPAALRSFNALLRLDPLLVLRLLRVAGRLPELPMDGPGARLDAVIDACGRPLLQAALLDADERTRSGAQGGAGHQSFWIHSLFTAEIARELALRTGRANPDDMALAGLLLDVALPLQAMTAPARFSRALGEAELVSLELDETGRHHGEAGADLLTAPWALELADALRFSHADAALFADEPDSLKLARAAEELAGGGRGDAAQQSLLAQRLTGLDEAAVAEAMRAARLRLVELGHLLGLLRVEQVSAPGLPWCPIFDAQPAPPAEPPVVLELARAGLLAQVCDHESEDPLWRSLDLASALLFDLPSPRVLRADPQQGRRFRAGGSPGQSMAHAMDFAASGMEAVWTALAAGQPWSCADARAASALPVGLQRLLRLSPGEAAWLQPLVSDAGVEALALYRLPASALGSLTVRAGELNALAGASAASLRRQAGRAQALTELRDGMTEQYAVHARQLRGDLHTPLGLLRHQVKSMRLKMGADSLVDSELTVFGDQIERIETVLRQFESRPPDVSAEAQRIDLNQLIEQVVAEADERLFRSRSITTELHLDSALPPLHLPLATLRELLQTLLATSAEHVGTSGRIAVSTAEGVNLNGALFAEIRIRDFGRGMDAARVAALFAADGSASGRPSLAQALMLARTLGGSLSGKSAVGQGTVFQLLLPRNIRRPGGSTG